MQLCTIQKIRILLSHSSRKGVGGAYGKGQVYREGGLTHYLIQFII